jgi:hypothetical protein
MRPALLAVMLLAIGCVPNATPQALADGGVPACEVGASRACACSNVGGLQTCIATGVWSGCGCATTSGADVAVAPAPPPPLSCGLTTCAQYVEEDSEVGAKGCCTQDQACGSKSEFLFGNQCLPRGGPVGAKKAECPDESITFLDVDGCCRSDGKCGLSIDAVPNFDLGCLERTAMAKLLNDGSDKRDLLGSLLFLPVKDAVFPPKACTP